MFDTKTWKKNIGYKSHGSYLCECTHLSTIFVRVINDEVINQLTYLHEVHNGNGARPITMQVIFWFFDYFSSHSICTSQWKAINVMILMFDSKNSRLWHKFSCIIVTNYWKVLHAMFQPQLHLCGLVQHATLEISYDKMMTCFFVLLVISHHLVFWMSTWKVKLCLTKATYHMFMSLRKKIAFNLWLV